MSPSDKPLVWLHGEIQRLDEDAIVIAEAFGKKTRQTPKRVIEACQQRLRRYDEVMGG